MNRATIVKFVFGICMLLILGWTLAVYPVSSGGNFFVYLPVVESPSKIQIAFASNQDGNWEIYLMNEDGSGQIRTTYNSGDDFDPDWSPNRRRIAFSCSFDICVIDADGSNFLNLTNGNYGGLSFGPDWSPDGTKIAFGCASDICVMNADGSNGVNLTNSSYSDIDPSWSPDGTRIAYTSIRSGNGGDIYLMNADGSGQVYLAGVPNLADQNPAWSPDGTKIAFASPRIDNWEIYLVNINGTNLTRLTYTTKDDLNPAWSLDQTRIATTCSVPNEREDICLVNIDGSGYSNITNSLLDRELYPDW